MTTASSKPSPFNNSARCNHRFPNGMRCRLPLLGGQPFCLKHTQPGIQTCPDPAETAATLTANLDDFTSAAQVNDFLSRLLLLLAQDKISTRRAAVLTYIASQLLRTLPAIEKENGGPVQIIFHDRRPGRDVPATGPTAPEQNPAAPATILPAKEA